MNTKNVSISPSAHTPRRRLSGFAIALAVFGVCALLWLNCTDSPTIAGVTEGGNTDVTKAAVCGTVTDNNGLIITGAAISIRPLNYLPDTSDASRDTSEASWEIGDVKSGENGSFRIDSLSPGAYVISALFEDSLGVMKTIFVDTQEHQLSSPLALSRLGRITGKVTFPVLLKQHVYIRAFGLEKLRRITLSQNTNEFVLDKMPQGRCRIDILPSQDKSYGRKQIDRIEVAAGESIDVGTVTFDTFEDEDYARWPHSKMIHINTTESAVELDKYLSGIPVLIRLDQSTVDFDQMQPNGDDMRFSDADGNHLAYQIDDFDADEKKAAVWVLIDRLEADSITAITMHWGRADVANHSLGSRVFGGRDYSAVYHLTENDNALANAVDGLFGASGKLFEGNESSWGVIGKADSLDGRNDRIFIDPLSESPRSKLTVSMWVKIEKWRDQVYLVSRVVNDVKPFRNAFALVCHRENLLAFRASIAGKEYSAEAQFPSVGEWTHVTGVYDGKNLILYLNGERADLVPATGELDQSTLPVTVGYCLEGPERHLNGVVDEIRIEKVDRKAEWIGFNYHNQKVSQQLISFE